VGFLANDQFLSLFRIILQDHTHFMLVHPLLFSGNPATVGRPQTTCSED
jgi:hypothetical protein